MTEAVNTIFKKLAAFYVLIPKGPRCNTGHKAGVSLSTCLCIHAEENALLEAGRERIREGSILYCDTYVLKPLNIENELMQSIQVSVLDLQRENNTSGHFRSRVLSRL